MKLCICILFFVIAGCATQQQKANLDNVQASVNGMTLVSNHPEIINTYIKQQNDTSVYCLEPDPDVTANFGSSLSLGQSDGTIKNSISASQSGSTVTTGGLSPMVLVVRELMYRACELAMNTNSNKQETLAIYKQFLSTIEAIATDFSNETGTAPSQPSSQ